MDVEEMHGEEDELDEHQLNNANITFNVCLTWSNVNNSSHGVVCSILKFNIGFNFCFYQAINYCSTYLFHCIAAYSWQCQSIWQTMESWGKSVAEDSQWFMVSWNNIQPSYSKILCWLEPFCKGQ